MEHFHLHGADGLATLFHRAPHFCQKVDGGGLGLCKDVYVIGRHAFLRDEHFFGAIDDKVSALDICDQHDEVNA